MAEAALRIAGLGSTWLAAVGGFEVGERDGGFGVEDGAAVIFEERTPIRFEAKAPNEVGCGHGSIAAHVGEVASIEAPPRRGGAPQQYDGDND
jgi:hypothetical protein